MQMELPQYQCHKVVRAAKIIGSYDNPEGGCSLMLYCIGVSQTVSDEWMAKHNPEIGGYYVLYEDGYASYSPAQAFEEGYTRLPSEGQTDGPTNIDKATLQAAARTYLHSVLALGSSMDPSARVHAALTVLTVLS